MCCSIASASGPARRPPSIFPSGGGPRTGTTSGRHACSSRSKCRSWTTSASRGGHMTRASDVARREHVRAASGPPVRCAPCRRLDQPVPGRGGRAAPAGLAPERAGRRDTGRNPTSRARARLRPRRPRFYAGARRAVASARRDPAETRAAVTARVERALSAKDPENPFEEDPSNPFRDESNPFQTEG